MATTKKVTKVGGDNSPQTPSGPTPEAKGTAGKLRFFAVISWILAIAAEVVAIILLLKPSVWEAPETNAFTWLIVLIVIDLVFVIVGSLLWKKANRYSPASRQDKVKFFVQNQLGLIIAIIAFLPLIVIIFTNKNLSGNQKKILGGIAVVAVLIAGFLGIDFNPPALEDMVSESGGETVYWTKSGTRYHLYDDCSAINRDVTDEIFSGSIATAEKEKGITQVCSICQNRANRESGSVTDETEAEDGTTGSILDGIKDAIGDAAGDALGKVVGE
jgi:hypothetical protein